MCVALYREGKWPETPAGIKKHTFHSMIRRWATLEDFNGPEILKHTVFVKERTPDEKLNLVLQVIAGRSNRAVALEAGIHDGVLYNWVRKYKLLGYNGLINQKKGRKPKELNMEKSNYNNPRKLEESEYEELVRLRAENKYIKAEIAVIKKEIALREEKEAARLKAKKQRSSKNSEKKDTN